LGVAIDTKDYINIPDMWLDTGFYEFAGVI
jgi:hypothetical protein